MHNTTLQDTDNTLGWAATIRFNSSESTTRFQGSSLHVKKIKQVEANTRNGQVILKGMHLATLQRSKAKHYQGEENTDSKNL